MLFRSNTIQPVGNARVGYLKSEQIASQKDREKYRFIVSVQESESMKYLYPVITVKDGQIFKEPAIYSDFLKDVYVSPLALDSVKNADGVKYGERFTFEISFKPYISLVPVGAVIILLGFFVAVKIRKKTITFWNFRRLYSYNTTCLKGKNDEYDKI